MNKLEIAESSIGTEQRTIRKHFTDEELSVMREEFVQHEVNKDSIEEEFADVKKQYKAKIELVKMLSKNTKERLRKKYVDQLLDVNQVPNHATSEMEFYDVQTGAMVDSRKLRPDEKQLSIHSKTA